MASVLMRTSIAVALWLGAGSPAGAGSAAPLGPTMYDGCYVGTADDAYNKDILHDPVDPNSAAMIASQTQVDASSLAAETLFGLEKANLDEADTARKYPVTGNPKWHPNLAGDWPWDPSYFIEYNGAGDAHAIVLDAVKKPDKCFLYFSYGTSFDGKHIHWDTGTRWELAKRYMTPKALGDPNGNSGQASGLDLFHGAVRADEVTAGNVTHALNFLAMNGSLCNCFVFPASSTGGLKYKGTLSEHEMPFGAHLRLHESFSRPTCGIPGSQAAHIVYALKHFGMYVSDTGADGNGLYPLASNTGNVFDKLGISLCLRTLHLRDFDVVRPPKP